jgi:inosine-uridine nucleoside N-ribohydrolase
MACAIDNDVIKKSISLEGSVDIEGRLTRGTLVLLWDEEMHKVSKNKHSKSKIRVVINIDHDKYVKYMLDSVKELP